jgi:hypothetical protein
MIKTKTLHTRAALGAVCTPRGASKKTVDALIDEIMNWGSFTVTSSFNHGDTTFVSLYIILYAYVDPYRLYLRALQLL